MPQPTNRATAKTNKCNAATNQRSDHDQPTHAMPCNAMTQQQHATQAQNAKTNTNKTEI
jgi:hypothetical protein